MRKVTFPVVALCLVGVGCGGPPPPSPPALGFSVAPTTIDDMGQAARLTVTATDQAGAPKAGTVTITAAAGIIDNAGPSATYQTDADGIVKAAFTCVRTLDPNCSGRVKLEAHWSSGAATMTQVQRVTVVPGDAGVDAGVLEVAMCMDGGNVLYLDGDPGDDVFSGQLQVVNAQWAWGGGPKLFGLTAFPASAAQGDSWDVLFSGPPDGGALVVGLYSDVSQAVDPLRLGAGFDLLGAVDGGARACTDSKGRLAVREVTFVGDTLTSFTAAFSRRCGTNPAVLRGCVHFEQGIPDGGGTDGGPPWHQVPLETVPSLNAIWGTGPDNVWAVGEGGSLLTCDTNAMCTVRWAGVDAGLNGIWGSSASNVWVVGNGGTVLHCNANAVCTPFSVGTTQPLFGVWGSGAGDVWAVGAQGTVLHFDGGAWGPYSSGQAQPLYAVWGSGPSDVWAGGFQGTLTHYDGTAWVPNSALTFGDVAGISGTGPNDMWAVSNTGNVAHWNGSFPQSVSVNGGMAIRGVLSVAPSEVYAVGDNGRLLQYDGTSWIGTSPGAPANLRALWATGGALWVSGSDGTVRRFQGADAGVLSVTGGASPTLRQVFGTGPSNIWAVGEGGHIAHWDGGTFKTVALTTARLNGLWGAGANDVWAVGANGTIVHFDGGAWGEVQSGQPYALQTVWGSGANDVWAGSDMLDGGGSIFHWGGSVWGPVTAPAVPPVRSIWGANANDVWAVGDKGTLTHWRGSNWAIHSQIIYDWRGVFGSATDDVWAAGAAGAQAHWGVDGGWTSFNGNVGTDLNAVWASGPGDVWAVGAQGQTLHLSANTPWALVPTGTAVDLYSVWGSSAADVWAVGSGPTVLHYVP